MQLEELVLRMNPQQGLVPLKTIYELEIKERLGQLNPYRFWRLT